MKSEIIFYDVDEEAVAKAENMNIPPPEPEKFRTDIYFDIDDVKVAYINREGEIALHMNVGTWVIPYNSDIWRKITLRLK